MRSTLPIDTQQGRKRCNKPLFLIPYFFTFANAFFGFLSVIEALQGNIVNAACCIGLAALADGCDGRLARAFGSSSCLGAELDALCDAISFCCAPTILMYSLYQDQLGNIGIFILGTYLFAGLFRLAKFNVTRSYCNAFFSGLCTPVSAFFLASLALYYELFERSMCWFVVHPIGMLSIVSMLSMLMISTIPFPSFKNVKYTFSLCYSLTVGGMLYVSFCWLNNLPAIFIALLLYVLGSVISWSYTLVFTAVSKYILGRSPNSF